MVTHWSSVRTAEEVGLFALAVDSITTFSLARLCGRGLLGGRGVLGGRLRRGARRVGFDVVDGAQAQHGSGEQHECAERSYQRTDEDGGRQPDRRTEHAAY